MAIRVAGLQEIRPFAPGLLRSLLKLLCLQGLVAGITLCPELLQVASLSLDSIYHCDILPASLHPGPLPHHQHYPITKPTGQSLLPGVSF